MQIVKEKYQTKAVGKCTSKEDVLLLWRFGFSKEKIIQKFKKDNKVDLESARSFVWQILYEEVTKCKN